MCCFQEKIVEVPQVEIREVLRRVPKTMVQYVASGQWRWAWNDSEGLWKALRNELRNESKNENQLKINWKRMKWSWNEFRNEVRTRRFVARSSATSNALRRLLFWALKGNGMRCRCTCSTNSQWRREKENREPLHVEKGASSHGSGADQRGAQDSVAVPASLVIKSKDEKWVKWDGVQSWILHRTCKWTCHILPRRCASALLHG